MQQGFFDPMGNFNWMFGAMPGMNPMNMGNNPMMGMNFDQNNFMSFIYGQGFNFNQGNQQPILQPDKINIIFKTTQAVRTLVTVDFNKPLSDTIYLYLQRVNRPDLFNPNSGIFFLYNANKINIYDKTAVGVFFHGMPNPIIIVNDLKNFIGACMI